MNIYELVCNAIDINMDQNRSLSDSLRRVYLVRDFNAACKHCIANTEDAMIKATIKGLSGLLTSTIVNHLSNTQLENYVNVIVKNEFAYAFNK